MRFRSREAFSFTTEEIVQLLVHNLPGQRSLNSCEFRVTPEGIDLIFESETPPHALDTSA